MTENVPICSFALSVKYEVFSPLTVFRRGHYLIYNSHFQILGVRCNLNDSQHDTILSFVDSTFSTAGYKRLQLFTGGYKGRYRRL